MLPVRKSYHEEIGIAKWPPWVSRGVSHESLVTLFGFVVRISSVISLYIRARALRRSVVSRKIRTHHP